MKSVTSLLVSGSQVALEPHQQSALDHRISCAWVAWHAILPQMLARSVPLRLRCSLLRSVVGACLMWGLGSINMPKASRRRLGAVQRRMVATTLRVLRRPRENAEAFYRRRERITTAMVSKHIRVAGAHCSATRIFASSATWPEWTPEFMSLHKFSSGAASGGRRPTPEGSQR